MKSQDGHKHGNLFRMGPSAGFMVHFFPKVTKTQCTQVAVVCFSGCDRLQLWFWACWTPATPYEPRAHKRCWWDACANYTVERTDVSKQYLTFRRRLSSVCFKQESHWNVRIAWCIVKSDDGEDFAQPADIPDSFLWVLFPFYSEYL
jgi:hypothetical protein